MIDASFGNRLTQWTDAGDIRGKNDNPNECFRTAWSPDGKRIVYYGMTVEVTWGARRQNHIDKAHSRIVSADGER